MSSLFFSLPPFLLTEIVPKLPTCVKTEVFSGREHGLGTWKQHVSPSRSPTLCSARHTNSEFTATAHFSQTLHPHHPAFFIIQSNLLLRGLTYVLLIEDRRLHANIKRVSKDVKWQWALHSFRFNKQIISDSGVFALTNTVSCGRNNKLRKFFPHPVPWVRVVDLSRDREKKKLHLANVVFSNDFMTREQQGWNSISPLCLHPFS